MGIRAVVPSGLSCGLGRVLGEVARDLLGIEATVRVVRAAVCDNRAAVDLGAEGENAGSAVVQHGGSGEPHL